MAKSSAPKPTEVPESPVQPEETGAPVAGESAPEPSPAAEPNPAAAAPDSEPEVAATEPSATLEPEAPAAPGKIRCRVNWRFDGFREHGLVEGDEVETDEAEAAPYLGGVLTRIEED